MQTNPIAISIVKLLKRKGRFLYVTNLDLFDETPILDIRAYTPDIVIEEFKIPTWCQRLYSLLNDLRRKEFKG